MQITMTSRRSGKPRPRLESTTPAVCNAGVMVELEPIGVSGSGREESKTAKLQLQLCCSTTMVIPSLF